MRRGELRWADLGEQSPRPVLAVHADPLATAATVIVLPVVDTPQRAGPPLVVQLDPHITGLPTVTSVKVDLIRALPAAAVGELITRLDAEQMTEVEQALRTVLDL